MSDIDLQSIKFDLQSEFNEKNRALHHRIGEIGTKIDNLSTQMVDKMGEISGDVSAIKVELKHRPDDGEVRDLVDERVGKLVKFYNEENSFNRTPMHFQNPDEITQDTTVDKLQSKDEETAIKIKLSDLPKIYKWIMYIAIPAIMSAAGYFFGTGGQGQ